MEKKVVLYLKASTRLENKRIGRCGGGIMVFKLIENKGSFQATIASSLEGDRRRTLPSLIGQCLQKSGR